MRCLLCDVKFLSDDQVRNHYIWDHQVNENRLYLNNLFKPDTIYRACDICQLEFDNSGIKKNHMFLFHYRQICGNRGNGQLPLNIFRRGPITYYSISYQQHKNVYDFFSEAVVENLLNSVYSRFNPDRYYKMQGYAEIVNQQQRDYKTAERPRVWLTNTYIAKHFNDYLRDSITELLLTNRQAVVGISNVSTD